MKSTIRLEYNFDTKEPHIKIQIDPSSDDLRDQMLQAFIQENSQHTLQILYDKNGQDNNTCYIARAFVIKGESLKSDNTVPDFIYKDALELIDRFYSFISAKGMSNVDGRREALLEDTRNFRQYESKP